MSAKSSYVILQERQYIVENPELNIDLRKFEKSTKYITVNEINQSLS
jgi:hypothetical protein